MVGLRVVPEFLVIFLECESYNDFVPLPDLWALLDTILKAGDKAALCLLVISRKKKSELVETMQIFLKNSSEILTARIPGFSVFTMDPVTLLLSRAALTARSKTSSSKGLLKKSTAPSRMA